MSRFWGSILFSILLLSVTSTWGGSEKRNHDKKPSKKIEKVEKTKPPRPDSYEPHGPVRHSAQNPIYLQHIHLDPMGTKLPKKNEIKLEVNNTHTNIYELSSGRTLAHALDMEMLRTEVKVEYGLPHNFSIGAVLPFLHTGGGFLDAFIQSYHNALGFPKGGRETATNGAFQYQVATNTAGLIYNAGQRTFGLSDVSFFMSNKIFEEEGNRPAAAMRFTFKTPTGNSSNGMGSGSVDYGLQLAIDKSYRRVHGYINAGYYVIMGNNNFNQFMNRQMFSWMAALETHLTEYLSLTTQFTGSTPLLKGMGLEEWDGIPVDFVIGFSGLHPKLFKGNDFFWRVGFTEDIRSDGPSTDFSTIFTLGMTFSTKGVGIGRKTKSTSKKKFNTQKHRDDI
jgi:hypothetical protein